MSWLPALSENLMPSTNVMEDMSAKNLDDFIAWHNYIVDGECSGEGVNISAESCSNLLTSEPEVHINLVPDQPTSQLVAKLQDSVRELTTSNTKYRRQIKDLQTNIDDLWDTVDKVERDLMQFMQYNRRENVEIIGVPEYIPDCEVESFVIDILGRIGVNISHYDIAGCHRLKNRKSESSNVIVRFICRQHVQEIFTNKKNLQYAVPEVKGLYIVENLCPRYKNIFDHCNELKNNNKLRHLWTYNGNIFIKLSDSRNEKPKKILHLNDLDYYFPNYVWE